MIIDTDQIVTMTAANKNFSAVAQKTEKNGKTVIFKNNRPRFVLIDLGSGGYFDLSDNEKLDFVARRVMERFKPAFLELAK